MRPDGYFPGYLAAGSQFFTQKSKTIDSRGNNISKPEGVIKLSLIKIYEELGRDRGYMEKCSNSYKKQYKE